MIETLLKKNHSKWILQSSFENVDMNLSTEQDEEDVQKLLVVLRFTSELLKQSFAKEAYSSTEVRNHIHIYTIGY